MVFGKVVKLQIIAYEDETFSESKKVGEPFVVQINPSQYQKSYTVNYNPSQAIGQGSQRQQFKEIESESFKLEFTLDGTGVVNNTLLPGQGLINAFIKDLTVSDRVKQLKETVYYFNGTTHHPRFIKIVWGDENGLFKGVLNSLQVTYTLFDPDGKPLRAKVVCNFKSHKSVETQNQEENRSSPDLTHVRLVKSGDTLPMMCYRIYGDAKYYWQVAQANQLVNFRTLEEGTELIFPPIEKLS